jgi:hypothetical protein
MSFLQLFAMWQRAQKLMMSNLKSEIRKQYPFNGVQEAIKDYRSQMTGGKILLRPTAWEL